MRNLGYAKHNKGDVIWEISFDNEDGTVDLNIDDLQGDITVCFVPKNEIQVVDKIDYIKRINSLKK